jgi:DegV family protein with EDD domain
LDIHFKEDHVKIVTDGGGDLPKGFAAEYGVTIVPANIIFGRDVFRGDVDLDADQFYRMLQESSHHPTTSQPTPGDFVAAYERARDEGHTEIISIHASSTLSGTFSSASLASKQVEGLDIRLIDTHTLSMAEGFQVMVAAAAARAGRSADEIVRLVEQTGRETEFFFTLDTLDYLVKGGRVGRVRGMVGSLLGLKPVITVEKADGAYTTAGTARTFKKAMQMLADKAAAVAAGGPARVAILHANAPDLVGEVEQLVREKFQPVWTKTIQVTPTLGVHTGPRAVGVTVARGDWPAGLKL